MLKTNEQLLIEKIENADKQISDYEKRIVDLNEMIASNRIIIDQLAHKRKYSKLIFDLKNNVAKKEKASGVITKAEESLIKENTELSAILERTERHLAEIKKTRKNLASILDGSKKKTKSERTK